MVGCFNIGNANLSVQENELLPFWRNVDGDKNASSTCDSNKENKIEAGSLECVFNISNSQGVVDTMTVPCKNQSADKIFNYFKNLVGSSFTQAYGKYTATIDSNITDGVYGEYKISLAEVKYNYCNGSDFVS